MNPTDKANAADATPSICVTRIPDLRGKVETADRIQTSRGSIADMFRGAYELLIPDYQRGYNWGSHEWEELVADFLAAAESGRAEYSTGTVLLERTSDPHAYVVVDGQQRLTSITLLIAALETHARDMGWPHESGLEAFDVRRTPDGVKRSPKVRLQSAEIEQVAVRQRELESAAAGESSPNGGSPYHEAFDFFRDWIDTTFGSDREQFERYWYFLLERGTVGCDICPEGTGQEYYERQNARGLRLSAADNVKAMLLEACEQGSAISQEWERFVELANLTGGGHSTLVKYWLESKTGKAVKEDDVDQAIKKLLREPKTTPIDLVSELTHWTRSYTHANAGCGPDGKTIVPSLMNIRSIRPLNGQHQLRALLGTANARMDASQVARLASEVEKLMLVNLVAGTHPNEVTKLALRLATELKEGGSTDEALKLISAFKMDKAASFYLAIAEKDWGKRPRVKAAALLQYLNHEINKEAANDAATINVDQVPHVEHYLSNAVTGEIIAEFGDEAMAVVLRNRIGNLTLLGNTANEELSNKPMSFKRDSKQYTRTMYPVIRDFPAEEWTPAALLERTTRMRDTLGQVVGLPPTNAPVVVSVEHVSRVPLSISLRATEADRVSGVLHQLVKGPKRAFLVADAEAVTASSVLGLITRSHGDALSVELTPEGTELTKLIKVSPDLASQRIVALLCEPRSLLVSDENLQTQDYLSAEEREWREAVLAEYVAIVAGALSVEEIAGPAPRQEAKAASAKPDKTTRNMKATPPAQRRKEADIAVVQGR